MFALVIEFVGLFLAGLLAGEEFIVRYGIQPALSALEDRAHMLSRIALVRKLMIVVPSLMVPAFVVNVVALFAVGTAVQQDAAQNVTFSAG